MNKYKFSFVPFAFFVCFVFFFSASALAQKAYKVKDSRLDEVSGIAASRFNRDVYYVHNDSGGKSEVYALNRKGKSVAVLSLSGVKNRDWEDIAVGSGPDPGVNYVYVGEIGDNQAHYQHLCLYRLKEPDLSNASVQKPSIVKVTEIDSLGFVFADGPKDCETLLVDPANGDVYLVSKREAKVGVYQIKAPLRADSLNVAHRILDLDFPLAVGGDISPERDRIIIKTYSKVYSWKIAPGQEIKAALAQPPKELPYTVEPQGEAICFSADGKSYLTISEKAEGVPLYLNTYKLKPDR